MQKMLRMTPLDGDAKKIARLIQDLDADDFAVRETAQRELDKLGDTIIRHLQQARANASSQELRNRIEAILKNRGVAEGEVTNEQLRLIRAIRVLEWAGTAEALTALDALTKEPPDANLLPDLRTARAPARENVEAVRLLGYHLLAP